MGVVEIGGWKVAVRTGNCVYCELPHSQSEPSGANTQILTEHPGQLLGVRSVEKMPGILMAHKNLLGSAKLQATCS